MRLDKIVWRTIASTLLAILILLAMLTCLLCCAFPSTMMEMTYELGMDGASVHFAMSAYGRSGSVEYVAFATETAIGADMDESVETCGLKLIADNEFDEYCDRRNEKLDTTKITYRQYVFGQVSVAQYRMDKKAEAQDTAFLGVGNTFPQNNAVVGLLITAITQEDGATVAEIKTRMQALQSSVTESAQATYLAEAIALCDNV